MPFRRYKRAFLQSVERKTEPAIPRAYLAGQEIPETGTYDVEHVQHHGPSSLTLQKGQQFPVCATCGYGVVFYLHARNKAAEKRRIVLHRIPDLDDDVAA